MGVAPVAVYSDADRHALHVAAGRRGGAAGPGAGRARATCDVDAHPGRRARHRRGGDPPGLRLSQRERRLRRGAARRPAWPSSGPRRRRCATSVSSTPRAPWREAQRRAAAAGHRAAGRRRPRRAARPRGIGYPVMLKSTAGGGGIGMRRCASTRTSWRPRYETVARLARTNFKDAGLYLEKLVARARHVEVQIFGDGARRGDGAGRARLLAAAAQPEGDRRDAGARPAGGHRARRWSMAAVRLGRAARYRSAGTVEFVLRRATPASFYFLEVNTRLQVEHGVTEEVTGVDLVEWMVRLAAGELPRAGDAGRQRRRGARHRGAPLRRGSRRASFQPSCRPAHRGALPRPGVRASRPGSSAGTEITPFYDPLLAKIIARGAHREEALAKLRARWPPRRIDGIETNLRLPARRSLATPGFRSGAVHTRLSATLRSPARDHRGAGAGHPDHRPGLSRDGSATGTSACRRPGRWTIWLSGSPTAWSATRADAAGTGMHADRADAAVSQRRPSFALTGADMARPSTARRCRAAGRTGRRRAACCALGACAGRAAAPTWRSAAGSTCRPTSAAARPSRSAVRRATAAARCAPATCCRSARSTRRDVRRRSRRRRCSPALIPRYATLGDRRPAGPHGAPDFFTPDDIASSSPPNGGALQLQPHRRAPDRARSRPGRGPTAARRGCTRRTSTTTPTRSAPSTSPATCR